jgi:cell division protein FtsQ
MWDDARALNLAAGGLALAALALFAWGAVAWLARQPVFALREVVVTTPLTRVSPAHVEAVIRDEFAGTLFTLDLGRARNALARVAWVRSVALRRQAPARLEVAIEEHVPLARWNDSGLVDTEGEVFVADYDGDLPQFDAPEGRSAEVAARYREWNDLLAPLALAVQQVALSARGAWHLRVAGGSAPLAIELGREEPSQRLARFVAVYRGTVGAMTRAGARIDRIDLRYRNGFAARVPGLPEPGAHKKTG